MHNVCTEIVAHNLCIGCGLCAALCPSQTLKMGFNAWGEYVAQISTAPCREACRLCLLICPFSDAARNEDALAETLFAAAPGVRYRKETGYYLESFVGYSCVGGHRERGASGGMATWVLETLLSDKCVDFAVCVSPTGDRDRLFDFTVCGTGEAARHCQRSCYYPVEASRAIGQVLTQEGKYAIVGLPCLLKAVRLAMEKHAVLRRRVRFLLGLVCGQTKSKHFAEYVCALGGGDPSALDRVTFRVKDPGRPASDFGVRIVCNAGTTSEHESIVFWSDGIDCVWYDRYFTPNACDYCDDLFAEVADMSFMDAWLPQYSRDPRGHSIVLVRNRELLGLLTGEKQHSLSLSPIGIGEVIRSQSGGLMSKREEMPERLRLAGAANQHVPAKRVHLCNCNLSRRQRRRVAVLREVSEASRRQWPGAGRDLVRFEEAMACVRTRWSWEHMIESALRVPKAILRRLQGCSGS